MVVRDIRFELEEEDINDVISSYEVCLSNEDLLELNINKNYEKIQEEESENPDEKFLY